MQVLATSHLVKFNEYFLTLMNGFYLQYRNGIFICWMVCFPYNECIIHSKEKPDKHIKYVKNVIKLYKKSYKLCKKCYIFLTFIFHIAQ